jgi:hypothetical protein
MRAVGGDWPVGFVAKEAVENWSHDAAGGASTDLARAPGRELPLVPPVRGAAFRSALFRTASACLLALSAASRIAMRSSVVGSEKSWQSPHERWSQCGV